MRILVGTVSKADVIKDAILAMDIPFTYEGKKGLQMIFTCETDDEKATLRKVKDELKTIPELGGLFYNIYIEE